MSSRQAFDPETLAFYAREAAAYLGSRPSGISRHLAPFLARLAPGARILELGCGGGRDSAHMIGQGFDVDPTDGVAEIAQDAARSLGRPVRLMRFDALDAVEAYDAVWANASLLHVPREQLPDIIARIWRALKPGGWHGATYKAGGAEGRDGFGRYYNYLSADQARASYEAAAQWAGMAVTDYIGSGYEGGERPWIAVTVRKAF